MSRAQNLSRTKLRKIQQAYRGLTYTDQELAILKAAKVPNETLEARLRHTSHKSPESHSGKQLPRPLGEGRGEGASA